MTNKPENVSPKNRTNKQTFQTKTLHIHTKPLRLHCRFQQTWHLVNHLRRESDDPSRIPAYSTVYVLTTHYFILPLNPSIADCTVGFPNSSYTSWVEFEVSNIRSKLGKWIYINCRWIALLSVIYFHSMPSTCTTFDQLWNYIKMLSKEQK